jgi:hypothetical protein
MQAAQRDSHDGFKINVEAQVAQSQLQEVLQAVISSSLKVCSYSLVIAVRTSKPIVSRADLEEAQRTLNDRRQRVVHAVTRMNALAASRNRWHNAGCSSVACRAWGRRTSGI